MPKTWFKVALFNFFFATCMGALLRFAFVEEVSWMNFIYWMHGHSHVAMLGWLYIGLTSLLLHHFVSIDLQSRTDFKWVFTATQFSVIGMMIFFPLQGYGAGAITFSSIHILLSYILTFKVWRGTSNSPKSWSLLFLRWAIIFMVLSTLAIWSLVPIMASGKAGSALYYGAVQFYLHFQFNGWFLFGILALLFKVLEGREVSLEYQLVRKFLWLLVLGTFLTFALAVTWSTPLPILFFVNSLGVILQLCALIVFFMIFKKVLPHLVQIFTSWGRTLLTLAFISFSLKVIAQAAVVIPHFATVAYTIRNYVIGFIHLILLGMVTCFLLAYAHRSRFIHFDGALARAGIYLFIVGLFLSEAVLFLQGTMFWASMGFIPGYYVLLFSVSVLIPTGVLMMILGNLLRRD